MKTFGEHVLILGGFYFIISFLLSLGNGVVFDAFQGIMFIAFIILLVVLCFKRKYNFLIHFQNQFVKSSKYLLGLGIVQYFEIVFITIPGIIYGYKVSKAQYNGLEIPDAPVEYLQIANYASWVILFFSLILVTYQNLKQSN